MDRTGGTRGDDGGFPTRVAGRGYRGRLNHPWRGRNNRGRGRGSSWLEKPDPSASWETQGELLATISIDGLPRAETASTVSNVEYIASYNWLDGKSPIIIVPGAPPVWAPPSEPPKLKEDSDTVYRDGNAARYPKHPYETAVRAVFTVHPQFSTSKINVVACGSTLGNLLRFARGIKMSFRFDAEFIGDSVFFIRKENSPKETIEGLYGYGHAFPEAYTNWEADVRGSVSHQRIIKYSFGGLNFLVRSESDGYLPKSPHGESPASAKVGSTPTKDESNTDINTLLSASSLAKVQTEPIFDDHIEIRHGGRKVLQDAIFDVKTRSITNPIDMPGDILPRLWVNQTPNFILGYHTRGHFEDVRVQDIRQDIRDWEKENERYLGHFNSLVNFIIDIARNSGSGYGLEVSRKEDGPIQVRRLLDTDWHALPSDLRQKWAGSTFERVEGEAQDKSPSERPSNASKNLDIKAGDEKDASK